MQNKVDTVSVCLGRQKIDVQKTLEEYHENIHQHLSFVVWRMNVIVQKKMKKITVESVMTEIDARKMNCTSWFWILLSLACMDQDFFWIDGQTR